MVPISPEFVPVSAREYGLSGDQAQTAAEYAASPRPRPPHPGLLTSAWVQESLFAAADFDGASG
jgi:hypothetical protein